MSGDQRRKPFSPKFPTQNQLLLLVGGDTKIPSNLWGILTLHFIRTVLSMAGQSD